jgi:hypothetical protein
MKLITTKADSHWYSRTGEPVHSMVKKDGSGERATTIKDARVNRFLPSVTTVLKAWPKEGLTNWRIEQAILAACTLPRTDKEPLDQFVQRVLGDMDRERDEAAEAGKVIHHAMASRVANGKWPKVEAKWEPFFAAWEPWVASHLKVTKMSESVVVNLTEGYAGCVDWVGYACITPDQNYTHQCVLDFKNQAVKNGKPNYYETWAMQLVAYDGCLQGEKRNALVSVVLDRNKPCEPYMKVWDDEECLEAYDQWTACLDFWKRVNNYDAGEAKQ